MNTERYVGVLTKFWVSLGQCEEINREEQWFQLGGATPTHQITLLAAERAILGETDQQEE